MQRWHAAFGMSRAGEVPGASFPVAVLAMRWRSASGVSVRWLSVPFEIFRIAARFHSACEYCHQYAGQPTAARFNGGPDCYAVGGEPDD